MQGQRFHPHLCLHLTVAEQIAQREKRTGDRVRAWFGRGAAAVSDFYVARFASAATAGSALWLATLNQRRRCPGRTSYYLSSQSFQSQRRIQRIRLTRLGISSRNASLRKPD